MNHILVTNDFPPKVGGIQSWVWELWRRLDPETFAVLTAAHAEAGGFDAAQPFAVHRARTRVLLPTPGLATRVRRMIMNRGADMVVIDPALPLGLIGPYLGVPYALVLHGAEVSVPAGLPGSRQALAHVIRSADLLIAAGTYPAAEARRWVEEGLPRIAVVPPGVDTRRFHPLSSSEAGAARERFGLLPEARVVVSVSRLVSRKGMDVLIEAAALMAPSCPELVVVIAGEGRDRRRLEQHVASTKAPVRLLGGVSESELPDLYGCGNVFAMLCRDRWGGLEKEGFGIVFLEAAACGLPQVAGNSGGVADAVVDGKTGVVVHRPADPEVVAGALAALVDDVGFASKLGRAARARVEIDFDYDALALRLASELGTVGTLR